jgi:hypothetical protein
MKTCQPMVEIILLLILLSSITISSFLDTYLSLQFYDGRLAFGQTFGNIINLSDSPFAVDSHLETSANYLYAVWAGSIRSGDSDVFFSRSADYGATFSHPLDLTGFGSGVQQEPKIAAYGNYVYIIWSDYSLGPANLFFTRSTDYGTTFSRPINLGTVFAAVGETRLVAEKNDIYIVWIGSADGAHAGSVLLRTSNNNGATFSDTFSLSDANGIASSPEVAASDGNVYVTWYNTTIKPDGMVIDNEILFKKSTDSGGNFSNTINLSNSPDHFSVRPQISVSGKAVYVTWFESGTNVDIENVFFIKSSDGGNTFSHPRNLSNNLPGIQLGANTLQVLASTKNHSVSYNQSKGENTQDIFVLWTYSSNRPENTTSANLQGNINNTKNNDVFFTKSVDGGNIFSPPINLSNDSGASLGAKMILMEFTPQSTEPSSISRSLIVAAWADDTGSFPGEYGLLVSTSNNGGITFSHPVSLTHNLKGSSFLPQFATSNNTSNNVSNSVHNLFLTWTQLNAGGNSILFLRGGING